MKTREPDAFEIELLRTLAEEQDRFERGESELKGTLWSRVSYCMARPRDEHRPSPVPGKWNVTDPFRSRFSHAVDHLIAAGLVRRKSVRSGQRQRRFALGYARHNLRERDVFVTKKGRAWLAAHPPPDPTRERTTSTTEVSWEYAQPGSTRTTDGQETGARTNGAPSTYTVTFRFGDEE